MILSYKHNFIFVKSRKTSGTSMEIALSTQCGEQDIVTPLANEDELIRFDLDPAALPRNFLTDTTLEEPYREAIKARNIKTMKRMVKTDMKDIYLLHNHASAKRAIKMLGRPVWDAAFKFTIERHPYEKALSWSWQRKGDDSLEETIDLCIEKAKCRNYDLYSLDGEVAVDFIIRYEQLAEDVKQIEDRLGLDIFSKMPRAKSTFREDRRPASEVLSAAQKTAIQGVCAEEFALMKYAT